MLFPLPGVSKLDPITEHALRGVVFGCGVAFAIAVVSAAPIPAALLHGFLGGLGGGLLWGTIVKLARRTKK